MSKFIASPICLYSLTLQKATGISAAAFGNFSRPKVQEIVVARGKVLELLRPDDDTGKMMSICSTEVFGLIRSLLAFRLVGGNRDYIVLGSDSGKINILQYNAEKNRFDKVHEETFGKSGIRRIVPGEYLAVDPKGRAVMIGAIEKQKLVYVLNRDAAANLTISSPLEAHKAHTLCYSMCGVDVGFENPIFAVIEADYEAKHLPENKDGSYRVPKALTFYELDLGLNHVTRKWSQPIDDTANLVIPVPGGTDGPGGVLVCAESRIYYMNMDHPTKVAPLPVRLDQDQRHVLINSFATHTQKDLFFFLVQTEHGDLFRVTLDYAEETVNSVVVKYFDTVPPTVSMCVLKTGFLFCASESSNHYLFQFQGIGDDDETPWTQSVDYTSETEGKEGEELKLAVVPFTPRYPPVNLSLIDEMDNLGPVVDMKVGDLTRELTPQLYSLSGAGPRSSLRVLRHGLAVNEMAVSDLPGSPNAVWAVKKALSDDYMSYIVVSFVNATIVLSIGETVLEVTDSGLLGDTATLSVSNLGDAGLLQVHPGGLRHVLPDKRINVWRPAGRKTVTKCAVNNRQVVIALTGGELVYFELDKANQLMEVLHKDLGSDVASLAIAPIPEGRTRSLFMVVGGYDNTVRVLSLEPQQLLAQLTLQAVPAQPTSLELLHLAGGGAVRDGYDLYLFVGLANGVLIRSRLEETDGSLSDARKRFLGSRAVRTAVVTAQGRPAILALSTRAHLTYTYQGLLQQTPLSYDMLEHASPFISEQCPEGVVCIGGNQLRIVTLDKLGDIFNQVSYPLRYTPRRMVVVQSPVVAPPAPGYAPPPPQQFLCIIESDHNTFGEADKRALRREISKATGQEDDKPAGGEEGVEDMDTSEIDAEQKAVKQEQGEDAKQAEVNEAFVGAPKAGPGKWASCIRIIDPATGNTLFLEEFDQDEAAFSLCLARLGDASGQKSAGPLSDLYVVVGGAKGMHLAPRTCTYGFLAVYRIVPGPGGQGAALSLLHKTVVDGVPSAICGYDRRLLVGCGKALRLYEMGKKKMLKKSENKSFPTSIQSIQVVADRIYVGDMAESFHYCCYRKADRQLYILADSLAPRYLTASAIVDYDSMAGVDKFGNFFLSRLKKETSEKIDRDPTGGRATVKYGQNMGGALFKLDDIANFHSGEMMTALQKTALVPGGLEVLVYATIMGGIGMYMPFTSREDVEFFSHLEMHLRQEVPPLCGRDHLAFRSYYFPVKDVVDGDLCEMFSSLEYERQRAIAEELVSTPAEVAKKLEELRARVM